MRRRALRAVGVVALALLTFPAAAAAHGLVGKQDLPIPRWLFAWAATAVLIVSFVALASLWPKARWQRTPERKLLALPAILEPLCGVVGVAFFAFALYAGLAGSQTAAANLLPNVIFVFFWVGLPLLSMLAGDVFRAFNPWRAIARFTGWAVSRLSPDGPPDPLGYPRWLGHWPAAIGVVAFVWVELIYSGRSDPSALAVLALLYGGAQLVGMSLYGVRAWTDRADAFGVYFGLFALLAPVRWTPRALLVRRPLSGAAALTPLPGTVALLCFMIGTTSFDGLTQGPTWNGLVGNISRSLQDLGLGATEALAATFTLGMVEMLIIVATLFWVGIRGMKTIDPTRATSTLSRAFVHALIPIALAYVIAHYIGLLAYQGQAAAYLASDPLGNGSNWFGTARATIDYGWLSASAIWYVQVAALIGGHAAGLALAHDRALTFYGETRVAAHSQYWMLMIMISFTCLALWLLSAGAS